MCQILHSMEVDGGVLAKLLRLHLCSTQDLYRTQLMSSACLIYTIYFYMHEQFIGLSTSKASWYISTLIAIVSRIPLRHNSNRVHDCRYATLISVIIIMT